MTFGLRVSEGVLAGEGEEPWPAKGDGSAVRRLKLTNHQLKLVVLPLDAISGVGRYYRLKVSVFDRTRLKVG